MTSKLIAHGCAAALACLFAAPASAQEVDPEAVVNALFAAGGNHPKVRATGAKGVAERHVHASHGGSNPLEGSPLHQARSRHGALLDGWQQSQCLGQGQTRDAGLCDALCR